MNYINYFKHTLYSPEIIYRRFDLDLKVLPDHAKRCGTALLPLISLYRPAGFVLSVGGGSARAISHFYTAMNERDLKKCSKELAQTTLAVIGVAGTFFYFSTGTLITTTADGLQSAWETYSHLAASEWSEAGEHALHTLSHSLYLGFILTGSLELMLAFTVFQALSSLYAAKKDLEHVDGPRYPEAIAKIVMGIARLDQARGLVNQIQRRNFLFQMQKHQSLIEKALNGRRVRDLIEHPLNNLEGQTETKRVILTDANGNEYDFGAHVHGFGQEIVKGDNLTFRTRVIDGKEVLELEFKVNHAFRDKLSTAVKEAQGWGSKEAQEILKLTGSHVTGVKVQLAESPGDIAAHHDISLKGLGMVSIGADDDIPNLYDKVIVRMDKDKTIYDLHEMISFLDLSSVLAPSTQDDLERMKLGQLFRTFFPREATPFERTEEFFKLPIEQLKEKMIEKAPDMKKFLELYFDRIKTTDLLPGRTRYQIDGIAEAVYEKGARALMAALTGARTDNELFERTASILKMGMLSIETRDSGELNQHGLNKYGDYMSGGADSIYTQIVTTKDKDKEFEDISFYRSNVRFLISLEALETGSYQYHEGQTGSRETKIPAWWWWRQQPVYLSRQNILEFVEQEVTSPLHNRGHEVMLKERLDPSLIKGLMVPDQTTKDSLLEALRGYGLVSKDSFGQETILGTAADKFIRVGTQITDELIA